MVDIFSLSLLMKKPSIKEMRSFAQSHTSWRIPNRNLYPVLFILYQAAQ